MKSWEHFDYEERDGVAVAEHTTQSDVGLNVVDHAGRLGFEPVDGRIIGRAL